jgi:two-component system response regulator HydG
VERVEQKPPSHAELCDVCGLMQNVQALRAPIRLVAESKAMRALLQRAARFASNDAPVIVLGESGTGKEVVARALHGNGLRRARPFVAVNVAALPADLLESELFGHARGAFTGADRQKVGLLEEAEGGTLFLDEIGEMPLSLQAKLLRALQDGEVRRVGDARSFAVDVRVICATHRDLRTMVAAGAFREDLYFRLRVLSLQVPPLRERPEDILPLARQFLAREDAADAATRKLLSPEAEALLCGYDWPGNVRELQSAMRHGAALALPGQPIRPIDLPEELREGLRESPRAEAPLQAPRVAPSEGALLPLAEVERAHILKVLDACGGSQAEAARVLGIARNTLWRKLRSYGGE